MTAGNAIKSSNLGFPRMGANRELKRLVENFWSGKLPEKALLTGAKNLRLEHWTLQRDAGIDVIPSNDFSMYDQVLDHSVLFGVVPDRYQSLNSDPVAQYFAMARGLQDAELKVDVQALEMKKWFDTNYHYIVPEFKADQEFVLSKSPKPLIEFQEAKDAGIHTRPVLLGPISFLMLGNHASATADKLSLLKKLMPLYKSLVTSLSHAGASTIVFDEPVLSLDLDVAKLKGDFVRVYEELCTSAGKTCQLMVANYFGRLGENVDIVFALPVAVFHQDFVRAPEDLPMVLKNLPSTMSLSIGVINGRNIWKADLASCIKIVKEAVDALGAGRVIVAPSCSLLHTPFSIASEGKLSDTILPWLSFSAEKLKELVTITAAVNGDKNVDAELRANKEALEHRRSSPLVRDPVVQTLVSKIDGSMMKRQSPFPHRWQLQKDRLNLPVFPTTTIGSFPQTKELRVVRQNFKKGECTLDQYNAFIKKEIQDCVHLQEDIGLDVLVHGEPERNDMVEYFGENLKGYAFSANGWVQSYGSRCVKPPILYGDVSRPKAMTVSTSAYAQTLTSKPMKGMLTGPVTMLQWSFVRDDQPRRDTTFQLALAIRKEVQDLEAAGIKVIQIDEPAIREGLPLRISDWNYYLQWAVDSFLLCSTGVKDDTQIHSHFCYSDFQDIFPSIKRLDADVITIENARSDLKLLKAFAKHGYTNSIGPGVYDIHSARVPSAQEIKDRLKELQKYISDDLLYINPDCGLKTRGRREVELSLKNMVQVARQMRSEVSSK